MAPSAVHYYLSGYQGWNGSRAPIISQTYMLVFEAVAILAVSLSLLIAFVGSIYKLIDKYLEDLK
jgi:hypothetical protein